MEGNLARKYSPTDLRPSSGTGVSPEHREDEALGRYTVSFGVSLAITSVLNALLVVVKELNENTLLAWMKQVTPHHWITHGLFDLIVFAVLGFALARVNGGRGLEVSPRTLIYRSRGLSPSAV